MCKGAAALSSLPVPPVVVQVIGGDHNTVPVVIIVFIVIKEMAELMCGIERNDPVFFGSRDLLFPLCPEKPVL